MSWRRRSLLVLIVLLGIGFYDFAFLVSASAKLLGYERVFDVWRGSVSRMTVRIGTTEADVYTSSRSHFPLLMVHGVNASGKNSPELRRVAETLSGSGFRVIVPDLPRLRHQNVTSEDIDDLVRLFKALGAEGGMVCASYGCGPALIAAAQPEIRNNVRFIITFGGYFDLTDTLQFIITSSPSPLAYSKWLYMRANSDLLRDEGERTALSAVADERQNRPPEAWTLGYESLGHDGAAMLALYESQTPQEFYARLEAVPLLRDRAQRLSPSHYFDGIRTRLIIAHIGSDPCIPSLESIRMAEAAKAHGIAYSLTILNMYGHTTPSLPAFGVRSITAFYLPEGWKFLRLVHEILNYAN